MSGDEAQARTPTAQRNPSQHSARRIKTIVEILGSARSYLEVGVQTGRTFNSVSFERKVAVDPDFQFDVDEFAAPGVEFMEVTSDEYFASGVDEKFDLIFLDGLHVFQQTFRDFCNSLTASHDQTVWVIDDTIPTDIYSAWPNQEEAVRERRRAGGTSYAWHGDVFKTIVAIHDFFPVMSFATIKGNAPQTLVWRQPRDGFAPLFNNFEAIERMTYFDLVRHQHVLNALPESQAFDRLRAARVLS